MTTTTSSTSSIPINSEVVFAIPGSRSSAAFLRGMVGSLMNENPFKIERVQNWLLPGWLHVSFPPRQTPQQETSTWWGGSVLSMGTALERLQDDPATLFQALLVTLVSFTVLVRLYQFQQQQIHSSASSTNNNGDDETTVKPTTSKTSTTTHNKNVSSTRYDDNSSVTLRLRCMQWKFLSVFWLLRTAFWMSGPYFYAAYASKATAVDGVGVDAASLISRLSLAGYGAIALFGPFLGRIADLYGRKLGTLLAVLFYGVGSLSINSNTLWILFVGRALGGVGTSLLSASPEAWLVSEFNKQQQQQQKQQQTQPLDPSWIRQTFGMAYAYDSVVAILAGQIAGWAANQRGPTGPFQVSPFFLVMGGIITILFWDENKAAVVPSISNGSKSASTPATKTDDKSHNNNNNNQQSIWDAVTVIQSDAKIIFLGGVQSLFEGAMYIFVMTWPPTMTRAIQNAFGDAAVTPYGTAFSCFMACCMAGSTIFGMLSKKSSETCNKSLSLEMSTVMLLAVSCCSLVLATTTVRASAATSANHTQAAAVQELWQLILAYFVFEACVGMYFPSIGTLRSKILPDSHRSVIMTLFGVPLNIIVVTVFLFVHKLGNVGALAVAAVAVGCATACAMSLYIIECRRRESLRNRFKKLVRQVQLSSSFCEVLKKNREDEMAAAAAQQKRNSAHERAHTAFSPSFFEQLMDRSIKGDDVGVRRTLHERRNTFSNFGGPQFF